MNEETLRATLITLLTDLTEGTEEILDTAEVAVDRFLTIRQDRRLGFDFERAQVDSNSPPRA